MRQTRLGERTAFRSLLQRHTARVLALAAHTLGHRGEAEEVVQEAFIRVWQHADRYEPQQAQFTTWLYRIVVNLCLDRLRKPRHAVADEQLDAADSKPDALGQMLGLERQAAVRAAIKLLPPRQRLAVLWFHFSDRPALDCAADMGLSPKAFESLLARGRVALRKELEPYIDATMKSITKPVMKAPEGAPQ